MTSGTSKNPQKFSVGTIHDISRNNPRNSEGCGLRCAREKAQWIFTKVPGTDTIINPSTACSPIYY